MRHKDQLTIYRNKVPIFTGTIETCVLMVEDGDWVVQDNIWLYVDNGAVSGIGDPPKDLLLRHMLVE